MAKSPSRARRASLLASPLVVAGLAQAQESEERHGIFLDTLDVRVINVEVIATDGDGNPVTDLTHEDFQIFEDGEPMEVTNFFAVEGRQRQEESSEAPTGPAAVATPEGAEDRTQYVVLVVDAAHMQLNNRARVFSELRKHLDRLVVPGDQVMVVALQPSLELIQPFTSDPELITASLDQIQSEAKMGTNLALEQSSVAREIERGASPQRGGGGGAPGGGGGAPGGGGFGNDPAEIDAPSIWGSVQNFAARSQTDVRQTTAVLGSFISSLAGLPGRKAVIYVSEGLELSPGETLVRLWDSKYSAYYAEAGITSIEAEINNFSTRQEIQELVSAANANRVSFYTVDAGGNRSLDVMDASQGSGFARANVQRLAEGNQQASLRFLAQSTGGQALLNSINVGNLVDRLRQDFDTYYSLGYVSPHRGDREYHKIRVEVTRPGVKLRYLEGYRGKTSADQAVDRTLAALLLDVADNPLEVRVELGEKVRNQKNFVVPVTVKVPISKLVLFPQEDVHVGVLSLVVAVRDDRGGLSQPQTIPIPVRIPNDQILAAMNQVAGYTARLLMRPGEQKIAIGVRDEIAKVSSTLNLSVDVGGGS